MSTTKNRIEIVNWRRHGADESYCYLSAYAADDIANAHDEIEKQVDADYDWLQDTDAEEREDWDHVLYFNDEILIEDGAVLEHNGRKFRVQIAEVKEVA